MKSKNLLFILPVFLCSIIGNAQNAESRAINDFTKIDVWGNIKIELQKSDSNSLYIDAKSVPLDEIVTEVKNDVLKIKMRSNLFKDVVINIKINYKEIVDIKANASAELIFPNKIVAEKLTVESIGGARVVLDVELKNSDLTVYQGGQVDIKGKSDFANVFANSGGILSATNLITDEANIKLNTGGKCEITVNKKLVARVNTKSSLSYFGKPEIEEIKTSLGANVSKWDE
ncbi:MAG: hypothetical protein A2W99_06545 [Bacteroidetes bacterium GWF2_33_16]|nr:MAG: hypothetical protein A2X00_05815 [Bacteroidetes bacterium GWE2_32_14]OFY04991.1 MAG: hypothetical protein A2W99_06545 [Bacteroidetes bacterium GWF2_33_16]